MLLGPVFIFLACFVHIVSAADWCYQSQVTCNHTCSAPDDWAHVSEKCNGTSQSPINIVTRNTEVDKLLTPFKFIGYEKKFNGTLVNNGHTAQLSLPSGIKITDGKLEETYKAAQLHLHWGNNGDAGSEHTIDGEQYPMEMHIVHIKEKYNTTDQAVNDATGVAVLGFFFKSDSHNKNYDPLINALQNITQPSSNTTVYDISLDMLIPQHEKLHKYFRYNGSLTTPNCDQAVVWTLFEEPINLSSTQLQAFSQLQFPGELNMVDNFRPVQHLNGRRVYYSGAHVVVFSTVLVIVSTVVSSAFTLDATG